MPPQAENPTPTTPFTQTNKQWTALPIITGFPWQPSPGNNPLYIIAATEEEEGVSGWGRVWGGWPASWLSALREWGGGGREKKREKKSRALSHTHRHTHMQLPLSHVAPHQLLHTHTNTSSSSRPRWLCFVCRRRPFPPCLQLSCVYVCVVLTDSMSTRWGALLLMCNFSPFVVKVSVV